MAHEYGHRGQGRPGTGEIELDVIFDEVFNYGSGSSRPVGRTGETITPLPAISEEAQAVFAEYNASNVDRYDEAGSLRLGLNLTNSYDEAGSLRRTGMMELGERQTRGMNIARDLRRQADWDALLAKAAQGTSGFTVVDQRKLRMQQSAIQDALSRGMEQLNSQFQLMSQELERQRMVSADEIQRSRLAALDSITKSQQDLRNRGSETQSNIMKSIGRTTGGVAAATQEALSRLGSTDSVISEGIRRRLEEEGQVERDLAASQGDIQADLAARLSQISQSALDRQKGLVDTTASGSSAELANLVARITAERAAERAASEFQLSEDARQRQLELMLNPPTRRVGGTAKGPYADQAALIDLARRQGIYDPGFIEILAATDELGDYLYEQNKPAELTTAMQLAPIAQGMDPEDLMTAAGTAISEGRFDDALTLGELSLFVPEAP